MNRLLRGSSRVTRQCVAVVGAATMLLAPIAPANAAEVHPSKVAGGYGTYGPRERAEELYLDGMEKLQAGRRAWARRTFENLIARYPQTAAADRARRQLGDLYPGVKQPALSAPRVSPNVPAVPLPAPDFATPARVIAPGPKWDREMRRSAVIQTKLRSQAGDRVFFSSGSAALGSKARSALVAQAQWLKLNRGVEATIEGHADEPGTDEQNVILSAQRAEAVRQRLVEEGVAAYRLEILARGRTRRVAVCPAAECRAQNRRAVTIVFVGGTHRRLGLSAAPNASNSREEKQIVGPARPVRATGVPERLGLQH